MKLKVLILASSISISAFCALSAQDTITINHDYHLIYIELSDNNNRMGLVDQLNSLYNSFTEKGEHFVSYISNARNGHFFMDSDRIEELFYLIRDLNTSLPDVDYDIRRITNHWNEDEITWLDTDGITHHIYQKLCIHYLVSPSFYDLSGKYFASKLLGANNLNELNGNTNQVHQYFYFSANDADDQFMTYVEREFRNGFDRTVHKQFITY